MLLILIANEKNKIQEKSLVKFKSRETSIVEILIKDLLGYFDFESINKPTKSVNYFFFSNINADNLLYIRYLYYLYSYFYLKYFQ